MDNATRLLIQTAVTKTIRPEVDATREAVAAELNPGDRKTIYIDGVDCGHVLRTKPGRTAVVSDESQFLAYCDEHGELSVGWRLKPGVRTDSVLAAIAEFDMSLALEFGELQPVVSDAYRRKLLTAAEGGTPVPGVCVESAASQVRATPNNEALSRAAALVKGAHLPALETGE